MVAKYLTALKNQRNLSWQEISDLSNVPVPTLRNIFSGDTSNPGITTVAAIVIAMGGSLDEMMGLPNEGHEKSSFEVMTEKYEARIEKTKASYESRILQFNAQYERQIEQLNGNFDRRVSELNQSFERRVAENAARERERAREANIRFYLMLVLLACMLAVIVYLFVDAMHGGWGLFRYQEIMSGMRGANAALLPGVSGAPQVSL